MEGNLSSGSINLGGSSYGSLDLQSPIRPHHHQNHPFSLNQQHHSLFRQGSMPPPPPIHENFPLTMTSCDQSISLSDFGKGEKGKSSASEEDEPIFAEDATDGHDYGSKGKKGVPWQRVKWTDKMVRLLITSVSYMGEDAIGEHGNGFRRCTNLQKKGKWKSISKVMAERGHIVSPQQCEDKFNDLNKRYKRLNEILGRGTSCQVVERPDLLDMMNHLTEKVKEEVRKILSSKQLFYEEMCSYHNKNRLHLPHDPELQRSLRSALNSKDDHDHSDTKRQVHEEFIEDDHNTEIEDHDDFEENSAKRMKSCQGHGDFNLGNSLSFSEFNKGFAGPSQSFQADRNMSSPEDVKENPMQKQWMQHRSLQLEEQRLQIQAQMLELERERFKWQRFCWKRDQELEMMRVENEKMKLENESMAIELKKKEMAFENK